MAIYTKPCDNPKCSELITATQPARLKDRQYHSKSCAMSARLATGWRPPLKPEDRARGGRLGGKAAGQKAHRRALLKAVQSCERFLNDEFRDGLSAQQLARLRVLMARCFLFGHLRGRQSTDTNRRYWREKARKAAA